MKTKLMRRLGSALVVALLIGLTYVLTEYGRSSDGSEAGERAAGTGEDVTAEVEQLKVAKEGPMKGYSRDEFPHWAGVDPEFGFGDQYAKYSRCESRDVMLLRDATGKVTLDPETCELTLAADGGWRDTYGSIDNSTGKLKPYKWITDSSGVDAEHIVALAEAWRSGADDMDKDTRRLIANDAVNLTASDPSANRSKGDQDAADYLPPGKFRCEYVARYVQVKLKYGLSVDTDEQAALRTAAADCAA